MSLTRAIDRLAPLLPAQGPISIFIHHNPLHAFEHLPFEEAVERAAVQFGREPFLVEARYRDKLASGRILASDIEALLREQLGVRGEHDVAGLGSRLSLWRAVLLHGIPAAAGLGGGSSDAAAVLRTLPGMLGRTFRPLRLAEIAVGIGADVPFFLTCRPSVAMGIGEILVPVPRFPEMSLVVAVPNVQVSTKWAYGNALPPIGTLTSRDAATTRSLRLRLKREPITALLSNDFQAGVTAAFPEVQRLKGELESLGAEATVMSGSGSAVVGVFRSGRRAEQAAAAVARPDRAYAVRVLRRRPAIGDDGR